MGAYLFWYKSSVYGRTQYIYIIAVSEKQARFFYCRAGYTRMYDYEVRSVDYIPSSRFVRQHEVGDILGDLAII